MNIIQSIETEIAALEGELLLKKAALASANASGKSWGRYGIR